MEDMGAYLMSLMSVHSSSRAQRIIQIGSSTSVLNANAALAADRADADRADAEAEGIANGAVASTVSGVDQVGSSTSVLNANAALAADRADADRADAEAEGTANGAVASGVWVVDCEERGASGDEGDVPGGTEVSNDVEDDVSEGDGHAKCHRGATRKEEHAAPSGEEVHAKRPRDATTLYLDQVWDRINNEYRERLPASPVVDVPDWQADPDLMGQWPLVPHDHVMDDVAANAEDEAALPSKPNVVWIHESRIRRKAPVEADLANVEVAAAHGAAVAVEGEVPSALEDGDAATANGAAVVVEGEVPRAEQDDVAPTANGAVKAVEGEVPSANEDGQSAPANGEEDAADGAAAEADGVAAAVEGEPADGAAAEANGVAAAVEGESADEGGEPEPPATLNAWHSALMEKKPRLFRMRTSEQTAAFGQWYSDEATVLSSLPTSAWPNPLHRHGGKSYTITIKSCKVTVRLSGMFYVKNAKQLNSPLVLAEEIHADKYGGVTVSWHRRGVLRTWTLVRILCGKKDGLR